MKKSVPFLVAFLISLCSLSFAGNYEDGLAAYNEGDYKKAHELFLIEAEKGNAVAQFDLGNMYEYGQGVPKDSKEAAKWYRMAAEKGDDVAQFNLGKMYIAGEGVPKSNPDAYAWWVIASANGNKNAKSNIEIAQGIMSSEEIEKGQQIAKEIRARIGN